jgi:hypothetical protein
MAASQWVPFASRAPMSCVRSSTSTLATGRDGAVPPVSGAVHADLLTVLAVLLFNFSSFRQTLPQYDVRRARYGGPCARNTVTYNIGLTQPSSLLARSSFRTPLYTPLSPPRDNTLATLALYTYYRLCLRTASRRACIILPTFACTSSLCIDTIHDIPPACNHSLCGEGH